MTCLVGKLAVLDLFGAFNMLFVVVLGYFVPWGKPTMQQRWIICWGIICAFNCIIDLIFGIMHLVQYMNGTYHNPLIGGGGYGHGQYGHQAQPTEQTPIQAYAAKVALFA